MSARLGGVDVKLLQIAFNRFIGYRATNWRRRLKEFEEGVSLVGGKPNPGTKKDKRLSVNNKKKKGK